MALSNNEKQTLKLIRDTNINGNGYRLNPFSPYYVYTKNKKTSLETLEEKGIIKYNRKVNIFHPKRGYWIVKSKK